ncbi:subtilase-type serine protease [Fusobacterium sp. PH5-7]|uniref:autotransporter outer membrane beta-barrel domain-containing protein n=1 Tax=Fusobacterium sp. PH5-7 TaxID=2940528 RepID=UPI00247636AA|nr:autotransporter domain-containing protein [Fusobacterium sp. PH5-7]MDH6456882.1 subtilase-type serine protease [Fusobacterium sp. PH5-7]
MKKFVYSIVGITIFSFYSINTLATESYLVKDKNGNGVFNLEFYNSGESSPLLERWNPSTYTLSTGEKSAIIKAAEYWAEVLTLKNNQIGYIPVLTCEDYNAFATSPSYEEGNTIGMTYLQEKLSYNSTGNEPIDAVISIGKMGFETGNPSSIPNVTGADLYGTMVHELAHTLGIYSNYKYNFETSIGFFLKTPSKFVQGLIDSNGKKVSDTSGNIYFIDSDNNIYGDKDKDFDASEKVCFTGTNVSEVLKNTSLNGVPVNTLLESRFTDYEGNDIFFPELNHLEMKRGLMSHQYYINYSTLMEAELAVLQDIGYNIDRRNFFGYSVYGNEKTFDNTNGYFLRDEKGEKYITGKYNTASYGIGLHIYGDRNKITQKADLLTSGIAGTGIRIDGVENTMNIDNNIKVYADGDYGTGILVAYGKNHQITNKGDIRARGTNGIGVKFDFGTGSNGKNIAYLGSYIISFFKDDYSSGAISKDDYDYLLAYDIDYNEINGALVENFNTSGYIEGAAASLYMSDNAYVKNINILNGAVLKGDIISLYSPKIAFDGETVKTETNINLGVTENNKEVDYNFSFRFDNNIIGTNIVLNVKGGKSSLNGCNELLEANVYNGAVLSGNAVYYMIENGKFTNNGTIAPGNSIGRISINGNYTQNGKLEMEFDGDGNHDTLDIGGDANFDSGSSMEIIPVKSYYANNTKIDVDSFVNVSGTEIGNISPTSFNGKNFDDSLTIENVDFDFLNSSLTLSRKENPYSKFASTRNSSEFGKAIDRISSNAQGNIRDFIGNMDFASSEEISSALYQASPEIYGSKIINSLEMQEEYSKYIANHLLKENNYEKNVPYSFGQLFYKGSWQDGSTFLRGYDSRNQGIVAGIEKTNDNNFTLGTHIVFDRSILKGHSSENSKIKGKSMYLGLYSKYSPENWNSTFLYSMARGGLEKNDLNNDIAVNSDWKAFNGHLMIGLGKDIKSDSFIFTPLVELGYSFSKIEEIKDKGLGINIDSKTYNSFYSKIGGSILTNSIKINENTKVKANISLAYEHQYIDNYHINGYIAGNGNSDFRLKTKRPDKDYFNLQGGLTFNIKEDLDISFNIGTDLFKEKFTSVDTSLSFKWKL